MQSYFSLFFSCACPYLQLCFVLNCSFVCICGCVSSLFFGCLSLFAIMFFLYLQLCFVRICSCVLFHICSCISFLFFGYVSSVFVVVFHHSFRLCFIRICSCVLSVFGCCVSSVFVVVFHSYFSVVFRLYLQLCFFHICSCVLSLIAVVCLHLQFCFPSWDCFTICGCVFYFFYLLAYFLTLHCDFHCREKKCDNQIRFITLKTLIIIHIRGQGLAVCVAEGFRKMYPVLRTVLGNSLWICIDPVSNSARGFRRPGRRSNEGQLFKR